MGYRRFLKIWRMPGTIIIRNEVGLDNRRGPNIANPQQVAKWLEDPQSRRTLTDLYESFSKGKANGDLKLWLDDAFKRGDFIALPLEQTGAAPIEVEREIPALTPSRAAPRSTKEKTWIEIELLDDEGQPVAHERYRIQLPSGETREDKLDINGRAYVDLIDPGECMVCFPEIDGKEWAAAG